MRAYQVIDRQGRKTIRHSGQETEPAAYWECKDCGHPCGFVTQETRLGIVRHAFCRACDSDTEQVLAK